MGDVGRLRVKRPNPPNWPPDSHLGKLLPTQIDQIAEQDPTRIFGEFIDSPITPDGVHKLQYRDLARAIDRLAWWVDSSLKDFKLPEFTVVCYTGFPDVRYYMILVAAIKCKYTLLIPSITNRAEASTRLIQESDCAAIFHTSQNEPRELLAQNQLPCFQLPELQDLLHPYEVDKYQYDQTYGEAASDPVLVMHTSGSTGFPKPVTWTNAHVSVVALGPSWPSFDGRPVSEFYNPPCKGNRRFTAIVVYHASMVAGIATAVFSEATAVFPPLHISPAEYTPVGLEKWLSIGRCETALMLPSQLNLIQHSPSLLKEIGGLRKVYYIGAPLSPNIANMLCSHVHLATLWGSTESGYMISHETDPCDYEYICIDAPREGIEWKEVTPSLYEMCYPRVGPEEGFKGLLHPQYIFLTFPELEYFSTGDLFSPHPSKPHHWRCEGRADNAVILSIGQNVNPQPLEERIEKHRSIKSAIVVGNEHPRVCLLLELEDDAVGSSFDEIWPHIQGASQGMRSFEQIWRSLTIIVRPDKPLPRTFKGLVKRHEACEVYREEIEQGYASL